MTVITLSSSYLEVFIPSRVPQSGCISVSGEFFSKVEVRPFRQYLKMARRACLKACSLQQKSLGCDRNYRIPGFCIGLPRRKASYLVGLIGFTLDGIRRLCYFLLSIVNGFFTFALGFIHGSLAGLLYLL